MQDLKTIARYELTGELGRGGMGVVYRANDPQLGREVAIKVILFPPEATDEFRAQLEKRFEREARSAASIHHSGVVTVHDFGRDGDYLYLVMELVAGESLAQKFKTGWLPERTEAFDIAARVADGLAAAHAAGVVHRDVTPRNILIASGEDGRSVGSVVITDFGIARSIGEETFELTQTGMLVGSPSFMAPEQVRNQAVDERADLFSLGIVLYQLLTGKLPFQSQDLTSLLYQIVHEDPFERDTKESAEIKGKLGLGTVAFLKKCLAKDAKDRIRQAADFAREARRLRAAAQTAEFDETVALEALAKGRNRRRGFDPRQMLVALVAIVALAAGGFWLPNFQAGRDKEDTSPPNQSSRERQRPVVPAVDGVAMAGASRAEDAVSDNPEPELVSASESVTTYASPAVVESGRAPNPSTMTAVSRRSPEPPAEETTSQPEPQAEETQPPPVEPTIELPAETPASNRMEPSPPTPQITDSVPPVLDIDDQPRELTATEVVLSGRVLDDQGGAVVLTVDGEAVSVAADGGFVARKALSPGRNSLAFVAVDAAGNPTLKSVDITAPGGPDSAMTSEPSAESSLPAASGQVPASGSVRRPVPPRFADRGDGTVADTLTGIIWTKRVEAVAGWRASRSYCKKLEMGRHRDWILPTIEELEELYRSGAGALTFPTHLIWSSTRNGSGKAWAFDFTQGQRQAQPTAGGEAGDLRVFCLRRIQSRNPTQDLESPFGPLDTDAFPGGGTQPPRGGRGGGGGGGGGQGGGGQGGGGGGQGGGGGGGGGGQGGS